MADGNIKRAKKNLIVGRCHSRLIRKIVDFMTAGLSMPRGLVMNAPWWGSYNL